MQSLVVFFAGLAAAFIGGAQASAQTHEVFLAFDGIFLAPPAAAWNMAMRDLGIEGARSMPDEVKESFQQIARDILDRASVEQASNVVWLDLVRLCLSTEVLRHLKPPPHPSQSRPGASHERQTPNSEMLPTPLARRRAAPAQVGVPVNASTQPCPGTNGMDVLFISGWPPQVTGGVSAQGNPDMMPFRFDPDFLRERVGNLLEALREATRVGQSSGMTKEEVDQHCPLGQRKTAEEESCCPICLEPDVVREAVRNLPCGHALHKECCEAWLATANTCPTCRFKITST